MSVVSLGLLPILLFFGGFSLPLGLPPLPEDPMLSRAAPEECLAYVSWAGTATPDAKSSNQTEQLLAEPEVQKLLTAIDAAMVSGTNTETKTGAGDVHVSTAAKMAQDGYPLAKTLLMRPAMIFLSKVAIDPNGPAVQGGAVFNLDEKAAAVSKMLEPFEALLPAGAIEKVDVAGFAFRRTKLSPTMPITWGIRGKYLIVGVGEGAAEGILQRAKGQPPAWLTAIRKEIPVDRFSTLIYFNARQTIAQFAPLGGPKINVILDALGLDNVNYMASVTGLDSKEMISRTLVALDGEPQGVLHLAAARPLTAGDLSPIPRDATIAFAGRLDAGAALELLLAQAAKADPTAPQKITRGIGEMERELGIDLKDDVLKPLGDVWCAYNSPSEGGLLVTGLTGVVAVKDHARMKATLNKLMDLFEKQIKMPGPGEPGYAGTPRIVKTTFAGQVICHLEAPEVRFPVAPSWCLTDKELIVATYPQNIKSYLSRAASFQSLAAVPDVAQAVEGGAVGLSYCDTRKLAEFVYPFLCFGSRALSAEMNREAIPLDASLLPSAAAIFPHLQPSLAVVRRTAAGVEITSRGPLAGMNAGPLLPLSFMFLGLARSAPGPLLPMSSRGASTNNLKQIALAVLNYAEDAEAINTLPPAFIADKASGKALLSWRVAVLPYIEQDALYKEFLLDEPWDSPHNKPLIARMPATFRSPSGAAQPGKTRYVTLRDKDSAFPGKEAVRFADITDGTSNTIMAVEADEAHAVIWTKPDDLEFNPKKPATGLTGQPAHGFLAACCDGSVHFISDTIDREVLRDLVNRHDGNAVSVP